MSDNLRRYAAVRTHLTQIHAHIDAKRHHRHLNTLAGLVAGIVAATHTQLPKVAQKAPDDTYAESRIRRFSRWLQNPRTTQARFYAPVARELIRRLSRHQPLVLVFDGSGLGRGGFTLMASAVYDRRALPLAWLVKRGSGPFSAEAHLDLLDQLVEVIPAETEVIFLGDGEFDSVELQRRLDGLGWSYVSRTAISVIVDDGFTRCAVGDLVTVAGERVLSMPQASVTEQRYGPVHVVVWHEPGQAEALPLVTNLEVAEEACHWYAHRPRIETLFSDHKSRGFRLERSHISDPERLARLLIAVSLAYVWMIYLGAETLIRGWQKRVHRSDRVDLSLFQLGQRLLEDLLNHGHPLLVAFNVPPPSQLQSVR